MTLTTSAAQSTVPAGASAPVMQVQPPPTVAVFPAGPTTPVTEFNAWAFGNPTPTVQWEISADGENWAPIPEATDGLYVIPEVTIEVGNSYRAVFTNEAGTCTSDPCQIVIGEPPPE